MELDEIIETVAIELLRSAVTKLPDSIENTLLKALEESKTAIAKTQLQAIVDNFITAKTSVRPMCQDTGVVSFFVKVGEQFPIIAELLNILRKATIKATRDIPLRPNTVDLFKGNTGNNVADYIPWIYWEIVPNSNVLELVAFPKGGGSTNVSKLGLLKPGEGIKGIKRFIVDSVVDAGAKGCPPYFLGIGIGGGEDIAMNLAKKALLRSVGSHNPNLKIAELEKELLKALNELKIGVMGLGEGPTVLSVHIEVAGRHPASLPVGIVFSCWADRHAGAQIDSEGNITYLSF
ncbi:fumarate hydratase [Candidatus Borrarchaeum sp.]|uniref:fumarate hydratase n=1 Tax=Candidatus Borrarchaeum sp. TaxID=2846742 RepID=UPI0025796568|nr:fumarate hydratase [Candidatus Borrarchaeum sp.]